MLANNCEQSFNAEMITKELRGSASSSEKHLKQLKEKRLLQETSQGFYRYAPATEELNNLIKKLKEVYQEKPVAVITCIFEKPDYLKDLSDAFKLKKD